MTKRSTKLLGGAAALAVTAPLLLASPTAADPTAHAASVGVTIVSTAPQTFAFSPPKVKISAGHRVSWRWSGSADHNVTFKKGPSSGTTANGSFSRRFAAPGKYTYVCTIHGFTGTVVVK